MKNIFLLPTDKPSKLFYNVGGSLLFRNYENHNGINIYITSDEEIKEGDYYVSTHEASINQCSEFNKESLNKAYWARKIILTTDQDLIKDGVQAIDDEFLEWFVKNPSCDNVEVESINIGGTLGYLICTAKEVPKFENSIENSIGIISIVNYLFGKKEGTLNLKNLEEKLDTALSKETSESLTNWLQNKRDNQKTLEEAAESKYGIGYGAVDSINAFIEGAKWQAGKMYSEKEVYKILLDYQSNYPYANNEIGLKKWFEQFKKK